MLLCVVKHEISLSFDVFQVHVVAGIVQVYAVLERHTGVVVSNCHFVISQFTTCVLHVWPSYQPIGNIWYA